jgi:hypothetical protein
MVADETNMLAFIFAGNTGVKVVRNIPPRF